VPRSTLWLLVLVLCFPAAAGARGGNYVVNGGTKFERAQIQKALTVSTFNWSLVPGPVTVTIQRNIPSSYAQPGLIVLDADLLDAGEFSWGVVQHEYAHQVDFALLNDSERACLLAKLGGNSWSGDESQVAHGSLGDERFASTLAWAYWPSSQNIMRPAGPNDEAAAMKPAAFRATISALLADPSSCA